MRNRNPETLKRYARFIESATMEKIQAALKVKDFSEIKIQFMALGLIYETQPELLNAMLAPTVKVVRAEEGKPVKLVTKVVTS